MGKSVKKKIESASPTSSLVSPVLSLTLQTPPSSLSYLQHICAPLRARADLSSATQPTRTLNRTTQELILTHPPMLDWAWMNNHTFGMNLTSLLYNPSVHSDPSWAWYVPPEPVAQLGMLGLSTLCMTVVAWYCLQLRPNDAVVRRPCRQLRSRTRAWRASARVARLEKRHRLPSSHSHRLSPTHSPTLLSPAGVPSVPSRIRHARARVPSS